VDAAVRWRCTHLWRSTQPATPLAACGAGVVRGGRGGLLGVRRRRWQLTTVTAIATTAAARVSTMREPQAAAQYSSNMSGSVHHIELKVD
jgi:hypothetical protein